MAAQELDKLIFELTAWCRGRPRQTARACGVARRLGATCFELAGPAQDADAAARAADPGNSEEAEKK